MKRYDTKRFDSLKARPSACTSRVLLVLSHQVEEAEAGTLCWKPIYKHSLEERKMTKQLLEFHKDKQKVTNVSTIRYQVSALGRHPFQWTGGALSDSPLDLWRTPRIPHGPTAGLQATETVQPLDQALAWKN